MQLSRIDKLFVDRDQTDGDVALAQRQSHVVTLICGEDVAHSYTLQLAVMTAANIASRCFPGGVRIVAAPALRQAPLRLWPGLRWTFEQGLRSLGREVAIADLGAQERSASVVVFGDVTPPKDALRCTFDGWMAKVGLALELPRLPEREYCSLSGVLAGALATSEVFLSFAGISVEASRRAVGLSLWRPDLDAGDPVALGVRVEYLPSAMWLLGLGHLGNAYAWALATLPYAQPSAAQFCLMDFDKVEAENVETGLLFNDSHVSDSQVICRKTRVCSAWLEGRGFQSRIIERRLDGDFRCRSDEPGLALCGFDTNAARRDVATARFLRVIESGLGGTSNNFDTISSHVLPNRRAAHELWPDLSPEDEAARAVRQARLASENAAYARLGGDECGRYDLAGKAVAVPFVGAVASCVVVAEVLRLLHGGPAFSSLKLRLGSLGGQRPTINGTYQAGDLAGLAFCKAAHS